MAKTKRKIQQRWFFFRHDSKLSDWMLDHVPDPFWSWLDKLLHIVSKLLCKIKGHEWEQDIQRNKVYTFCIWCQKTKES